jgi:hypothetical protein
MNNTLQGTVIGHAIAVQGGADNVVVGNTINGAGNVSCGACDGILLNSPTGDLTTAGSLRNRIERNTIQAHRTDGITLTDGSRFNYVGLNTVKNPLGSPTTGVGVWVNNDSNGNYVFGNDLSGAPENGIDVLTSKSTYVQANRVHGNVQGGIWVANYLFAADATSPVPQDTVLHHNYSYFNTQNGQVILEGAANVDVGYNFLSGQAAGAPLGTGTLAGLNTGGVLIHEGGLSTRGSDVASTGVTLYENTITDVNNRAIINGNTTNTQFFRNRFLNGSNNPLPPSNGRQGLTYSFTPAGVQWDASRFLGGNHWSDFTQASGNPDTFHQYKGFVYDGTHGPDGNGPYVDKFPYSSDNLGAVPYGVYSVTAWEPVSGQVLAAGTTKTVRWTARGCTLVDLSLSGSVPIVTSYPNVGYFFWTVPAVAPGTYFVRVDCRDATGGLPSVQGDTSTFTIGTTDLVLLNPGRAFRATNGGTVRVAWKKSGAVGNVNIFVKSGSAGAETQVGTNLGGTFADITLPAAVSDSARVTIRIVDAGNSTRQDSVDGFFMTRGTTPSFTTTLINQTLGIGEVRRLEWKGTSSSYTVDLDLYETGAFAKAIVHNLPDFGNYTWFVPEMWSASSIIRATFKDASGATVGTADTATFRVFYTTVAGVPVDRYRLYSPVTLEHLFTTDLNEYNVLGGQAGVWTQEGAASKMHNGPANIDGVEGKPYYRLYDYILRWHHWTTDRNEYFTLRGFTGRYVAEGVDGYIFPTQVTGTTPWYRLLYPSIAGLHHWTADQNERDTLVNSGFWIEEQKEFVPPAP